ncbi:MAG TPA: hypothetical protein EYP17_02715 [Candidatus Latescibacteria bacterium]|nr:hypothetical protein [Candidatus Latescibacterota bacterium]
MARIPKTGLARRIREVLRERFSGRTFRPREVAEALGIPPGREREKVSTALNKDFRARGEVVRFGDGRYRYVGGELKRGYRPRFKIRIARAIYYQKVITVAEIAALAKANPNTVHKFLQRNREWFEEVGKKRMAGGIHKVYRLVREDEFWREFVLREEERRPL